MIKLTGYITVLIFTLIGSVSYAFTVNKLQQLTPCELTINDALPHLIKWRSRSSFHKFLDSHGANHSTCVEQSYKVDFSTHQIIGVFLGTRPHSGYQFDISFEEQDSGVLDIKVLETEPSSDTGSLPVETPVYYVFVIPIEHKHVELHHTVL